MARHRIRHTFLKRVLRSVKKKIGIVIVLDTGGRIHSHSLDKLGYLRGWIDMNSRVFTCTIACVGNISNELKANCRMLAYLIKRQPYSPAKIGIDCHSIPFL